REEAGVAATEDDVALVLEAELPRHVLGSVVSVDDQRDQPARSEPLQREVAHGPCRLGRVAAAPERPAQRVAHLELGRASVRRTRRLPGLRVPDDQADAADHRLVLLADGGEEAEAVRGPGVYLSWERSGSNQ